jgi:hypothetical protein
MAQRQMSAMTGSRDEVAATDVDDGFFVSASEQREWRNFIWG